MDALEGNTDFGKEIIPSLVSSKIVRCHIFDDYWEDIEPFVHFSRLICN